MEGFPSFGILRLDVREEVGKSGVEGFGRGNATTALLIEKGGDGTESFEGFGTPA